MYIREYLNYILFFRAKNRRFRRNINVGGKKKDGTEVLNGDYDEIVAILKNPENDSEDILEPQSDNTDIQNTQTEDTLKQ